MTCGSCILGEGDCEVLVEGGLPSLRSGKPGVLRGLGLRSAQLLRGLRWVPVLQLQAKSPGAVSTGQPFPPQPLTATLRSAGSEEDGGSTPPGAAEALGDDRREGNHSSRGTVPFEAEHFAPSFVLR